MKLWGKYKIPDVTWHNHTGRMHLVSSSVHNSTVPIS